MALDVMKPRRWTDASLKALGLPHTNREQRVLIERGLYLFMRARADGTVAKQWQHRAQVDGSRRWLSLGSYPAVGLAKAREALLAQESALVAARRGEADHPALVARQARRAARAEPTVQAAYEEWITDKRMGSPRKQGEPVRERTIQILEQNYNRDIGPRIGDSKIGKVPSSAIQSCIDGARARKSPGAAALVYRTLRGLMRFAIKRRYVVGIDPMQGIENPKPYRAAQPNAASDAEIKALLQALDASRVWPATRLAIEFQLLTGARPGEVRLATWPEIDLAGGTWNLPKERVKTGRAFRIHLSERALEVLLAAEAIAGDGTLVFPGAHGLAQEKMAVARALSRLTMRVQKIGGKHLRPHDLRKTFRTMLSRLGTPPHVAELCLNHLESETMRRVYDGHDYWQEMRDAWDRIGKHMSELRREGGIVLPFRRQSV